MANLKIVIIGGVACGCKAASRARRKDPTADITIIEKGANISYAGCGLPYFIAGAVPEIDHLMSTSYGCLRDSNFFESVKAVKVRVNTEALSIDRKRKTVKVVDCDTNNEDEISYDKLVIATGALPVVPPFEGINLKQVWTLRRPEDARALRETIEAGNADRVTIVGGGRIGLEVADAFGAQAVETTVVELADQVMPGVVDRDIGDYIANVLRGEKVNLKLGEKVLKFEGDDNGKVCRVITDKSVIETDAVLVSVGVRPNVQLAKDAGLEIGPTGAIAVNEHMRTSDPDIYAGGDCVESTNLVSGKKSWVPLGSTANRHGRVIGDNVTGGNSVFPGIVGTSIMKTLGISVGRTGLTEEEAKKLGFDTVVSVSPGPDRSHFFPGGKGILVKLVVDRKSRKVLGVQVAGPGDVVRRIDVVATLLTFGGKLEDLAELDLAYAPPFSAAMDNLHHAANIIRNKLDGLMDGIHPSQVREKMLAGDDFAIVDVRLRGEFEKAKIEDARVVNIPLDEIRKRENDIPKGKNIFVLCQLGARAYEGARTIMGLGADKVKVIEGGLNFWNSIKPSNR